MNIQEVTKKAVSENPVAAKFLKDACMDDMIAVWEVLDFVNAGSGLSLSKYRKIQEGLEGVYVGY